MKKLSMVLSLILVLTFTGSNIGFTQTYEITQDEMRVQIENLMGEIKTNLEDNIEGTGNNKHKVFQKRIDDSITYSENLAEDLSLSRSFFGDIYDRYIRVRNIMERQYELKKSFIANTNDSISILYDIKKDSKDIYRQVNLIFNSQDRELSSDEFYEIMAQLKELNLELKTSKYITGSLAKESLTYIKQVVKLDIFKATETFEIIVGLQEDQLELLKSASSIIGNINLLIR